MFFSDFQTLKVGFNLIKIRSTEERIATVTTNISQYYTTDPQTDGLLVLVQDEDDTTREI